MEVTQGGSASDARDGNGGRLRQRAHDAETLLGVRATAVSLHHHALARAEGDDVGAVLESPARLLHAGDRLREDTLDQDSGRGVGRVSQVVQHALCAVCVLIGLAPVHIVAARGSTTRMTSRLRAGVLGTLLAEQRRAAGAARDALGW
jgi:hypothetical protein